MLGTLFEVSKNALVGHQERIAGATTAVAGDVSRLVLGVPIGDPPRGDLAGLFPQQRSKMLAKVVVGEGAYRYTDLGNFSENVPLHTFCNSTCTSPSSNALINLHPTFQTVTVGIGLNF